MPSTSKPAIVFCHGLWADGSRFSKVIPALQADGHEVLAVQYGFNSYADDVATVKRSCRSGFNKMSNSADGATRCPRSLLQTA